MDAYYIYFLKIDDLTDSSSDGCRESLSDDLQTISISTPAENYLWGLK